MAQHPDPGKERRWLDLVQRWRSSRLTVHAFCERHRLSEPNFYAWRRVLRQRGLIDEDGSPVETPTPAFMKITVDPGAVSSTASAIDLVLPQGRLLRVRPGFDPELLRQLVQLLEEPSW
jgi:transposase